MAVAEDRRRLASRLTILRVAVGVVFGMLAGSFWFLQVVQHVQYQEMAENNHQRTLTLRAPRGIIYDRTGKLLRTLPAFDPDSKYNAQDGYFVPPAKGENPFVFVVQHKDGSQKTYTPAEFEKLTGGKWKNDPDSLK